MNSYYTSMLYLFDANSEEELFEKAQSIVRSIGFDYFAYIRRIEGLTTTGDQRLHIFGSYPDAWLHRYAEMRYDRVDPCFIHLTAHAYPIPWSREFFSNGEAVGFYEEAMAHGVSAGALSPCARGAGLGVARAEDAHKAMNDVIHAMGNIHMLGGFLHAALDRFISQRSEGEISYLTKRERQCLQLAILGKRDSDIAEKLRISERTVLMHLGNVAKKLGAQNRAQMTAKSILMGLISA